MVGETETIEIAPDAALAPAIPSNASSRGDEDSRPQPNDQGQHSTQQDGKNERSGVAKKLCYGLIVAVVSIAGAVGASVALSGDDDPEPIDRGIYTIPPTAPAPEPTLAPTGVTLEPTAARPTGPSDIHILAAILLPGVDLDDLDSTDDRYSAIEWLAYEDAHDVLVDENSTELHERFALLTLYNAGSGFAWNYNSRWLSGTSHCNWERITCDDTQSVIEFDLTANNVVGTIPPEMKDLTKLKRFGLGNNFLSGGIPTEVGSFAELTSLEVWGNSLSGSIPTELGKLSLLEFFEIASNKLSGTIPSELGNIVLATTFSVWNNPDLTGTVPTELGQLTLIKEAYFDDTALTGGLDTLFCDSTYAGTIDFHLWSDCGGSLPPITICSCCTACCDQDYPEGEECAFINY
jgi:hypothetical protein